MFLHRHLFSVRYISLTGALRDIALIWVRRFALFDIQHITIKQSAYKQEHTRYNILDLLNGSQEVSGFLSLKSRGLTNNFGEIQRRKMKLQGANLGQDVVENVVSQFPREQENLPQGNSAAGN